MSWLLKKADSDVVRIKRNIMRLESLRDKIHSAGDLVVASNSGGYVFLQNILKDPLVLGRPPILKKLTEALIGENHQKIALDAPLRFQKIMIEAEDTVMSEIRKEKRKLRDLSPDE